jgi:autotransporter-associated beta strand protein
MKKLFPVIHVLSGLIAVHSFAASATWSANPISGDWNTAANWVPATVPNGPTDVATFANSNVTSVSFSANTEVSQIIFTSDASAYTFRVSASLTLDAPGLTNSSGQTQQFFVVKTMTFKGSSSAGSGTIITGNGFGVIITFTDTATADHAIITAPFGAGILFLGQSTVGSANITLENNAYVQLDDDAYAGATASITCDTGGHVYVDGQNDVPIAVYDADTGTGYVEVGEGSDRQPSAGSIAGDGLAIIDNGSTFVVGSNNLSTEFAGDIIDDLNTGKSGALSKVGTGTLTLSASSGYSKGTTVNSGVLLVKNTSGSGTGSGPVTVAGGTLGGRGIISGKVNVGTGNGTGAVVAPSQGASNPTILTLQNQLIFKPDGSYLFRLNTNKATADQVIANGVTVKSGAQFTFKTVANKKLTVGTVFTAINNTAATAIGGSFANLADGSTVTVGVNKLQASYSGGDGNDLTLTVVP